MRKYILLFCVAFIGECFAATSQQLRYYLWLNGDGDAVAERRVLILGGEDAQIVKWETDIPRPTEQELPSVEASRVLLVPTMYRKVVDGQLVEMTEAEKQALKPAERKAYEKAYFDLTAQILTAVGDERAAARPKLGFTELSEALETLKDTEPMQAIFYTLELFKIDAALKRYEVRWWEDAYDH